MALAQHPRPSPHAPTGLELVTGNRILLEAWVRYQLRVTGAGRFLILPTFLFGLWGSTSLDHQVHVACLYALGLWLIAALCLPLARPHVRLAARHADRAVAGEALAVDLEVTPQGRWPESDLYVVPHRAPAAIDVLPAQGVPLPPLTPDKAARVTLELRCERRGAYTLPGFRVCSDFPFGLLTAYRIFGPPGTLLVLPRFTPLARLQITPGRRYHPGGVALASQLGDSLEFIGSRPFREGDSVRDIDWPATARLDQIIVREFRQEYFHRVAVILDTYVPPQDDARRDDFERAVSLAASVSDFMARQEYLVDLFAAGPDVYHLTAGRSLAYVDEILEILACVESGPRQPFADLEPEIGEHLAQITTVVCVFLDWDEARRAFAERLSLDGAALKVIVVRDAPTALPPETHGGPIPIIGREDFARGVADL